MNEKQSLQDKVKRLQDNQIHEIYSIALSRAMETNPLKSWTIKSRPTAADLAEILDVLPLKDCRDLEDLYI